MACCFVVAATGSDQLLRSDQLLLSGNEAHGAYSQDEALPLPLKFIEFLQSQNVDPQIYYAAQYLPRYIRLKPSARSEIPEIEAELRFPLAPVEWMPGFFRIPAQVNISYSDVYKQGKIYGMDVASGAPVATLDIKPGDHVLDVCTAPGAKFCMMAEVLGSVAGSLTGVDISRHRLAACRTMVQKYDLGDRSRLFLADGTSFSIAPLRGTVGDEVYDCSAYDGHRSAYLLEHGSLKLKEWRPRKTRKEKRAEQKAILQETKAGSNKQTSPEIFFYGKNSGVVGLELPQVLEPRLHGFAQDGYDKVLVDAECTHDGSLKHIYKFEQWGWDTFERRFLDKERVSTITDLQLELLSNGFRLLKLGGTLVYSTCSFTRDQNEGVVQRFLETHPNAELREIEAAKSWPCKRAGLRHCIRFDPLVSNTNGQFVAKVLKVQ